MGFLEQKYTACLPAGRDAKRKKEGSCCMREKREARDTAPRREGTPHHEGAPYHAGTPRREGAPRQQGTAPHHEGAPRHEAAPQRAAATGQPQGARPVKKKKKRRSFGRILGGIFLGFLKFCFAMMCLGIIAASVVAVMVSSYLAKATVNDEALLDLDNLKLSYSSVILVRDSDTGEFYEFLRLVGDENREWVELKDIPLLVQNAFIAAEDQNFRTHSGFSIKRNVFAVLNELSYKFTGQYLGSGIKQGASTIDQQLVKNLLDDDDTEGTAGYMRKLREVFRAYVLERRYSKDMILEAYLNIIPLTGINAGVEAGAQRYFGKSVQDLSLPEAASLACITNNPTRYNPWNNPEEHLGRRDYVLQCMQEQGYISESEYQSALATPLDSYLNDISADPNIHDQTTEEGTTTGNKVIQMVDPETGEPMFDPETGEPINQVVPYTSQYNWFVEQVLNEVTRDLMEQKDMSRSEAFNYIFNNGLRIYATMDPKVQSIAEQVMADATMFPQIAHELTDDNGQPVTDEAGNPQVIYPQSAMAVINYDGELVAVVGGLGTKTEDRAFNRATDARRPIGSTMKPIGAYGLGIEYDLITYSTYMPDMPIQVPAGKLDAHAPDPNAPADWPRNYAGTPSGNNFTVAEALARSLNTIAVRVGQQVTPENSFEFLTSTLQISSLIYPNDVDLGPMNLGSLTEGISPYELAGAYMIFGNGGRFTTLHSYLSVEDRSGDIVVEPVITTMQAISEETAMIMNKMLYGVLHSAGGTGNGLYVRDDMDSVGKTGTTSDDKDHWFVGLTPYYCTATWWGYDKQVPLNFHQYGKHPPTLAWRAVMEQAQEGLEFKAFPTSEGVVTVSYCTESGSKAGPNCPSVAVGYYKADGRQPDDVCPVHGG